MLSALKSLFSSGLSAARSANPKTADLEARLAPAAGASGYGEVEYSEWADGERTLEIELGGIGPGDIELSIGGAAVTRLPARGVRIDRHVSTRAGETVPACRIGERVEIRQNGALILSGAFTRD